MSGILQLVSGDGAYDVEAVERYLDEAGIKGSGTNYTVVSIMGPQSSGKSTLLNAVFGTKFEEMDALRGRQQTTKGIWLAPCRKISSPATLIMDLEGNDGRERGEDDTSFERQSASFALAVSDVLLVNMWAKDVGRETGAGKPLLKTIFQANLRLFGGGGETAAAEGGEGTAASPPVRGGRDDLDGAPPSSAGDGPAPPPLPPPAPRRKTILLFVFRDKTRTPVELLSRSWSSDLESLWEGVPKPRGLEGARLDDYFQVRYAALSNYEERPEDFAAEALLLRRRFEREDVKGDESSDEGFERVDAAGRGGGDDDDGEYEYDGPTSTLLRPAGPGRLPAAALSLSMAKAWEAIASHRDLDLPAHRVMVANLRCQEIANAALERARAGDAWASLSASAATAVVPGFGARASAVLADALADYDAEARFFDSGVSDARRAALANGLAELVRPVADAQLSLLSQTVLAAHSAELDALARECSGGLPPAEGERPADEAGLAPPPAAGFAARATVLAAEAETRFAAAAEDLLVPPALGEGELSTAAARLAADLASRRAATADAHVSAVVREHGDEAARRARRAVGSLLDDGPAEGAWARIEAAAAAATAPAVLAVRRRLGGWELEPEGDAAAEARVADAAREAASAAARDAARTALPRVKERFSAAFSRGDDGLPRSWGARADVSAAASAARRSAAALLAQLCVDRSVSAVARLAAERGVDPAVAGLAAGGGAGRRAAASAALSPGLGADDAPSPFRAGHARQPGSPDRLGAASTAFDLDEWPGVPSEAVLLSPAEARAVWRQADADAALLVAQAQATKEANAAAGARRPPLWAIAAMILLGFNEAVALLKNPLLVLLLLALVLLARTVWVELDVEAELQRGALPGGVAIAAKLGPTIRGVIARTIERLQEGGAAASGDDPARRVLSSRPLRFEDSHAFSDGLRDRRAGSAEAARPGPVGFELTGAGAATHEPSSLARKDA